MGSDRCGLRTGLLGLGLAGLGCAADEASSGGAGVAAQTGCAITHDYARSDLMAPAGGAGGAAGGGGAAGAAGGPGPSWDPVERLVHGTVTRVDATGFTVSGCLAETVCEDLPWVVTVNAPGRVVALPAGEPVEVSHTTTYSPFFTSTALRVSALGAWRTTTGTLPAGALLLAATEGGVTPPESWGFTVEAVRLDCPGHASDGCASWAEPGAYHLVFHGDGPPTPVAMGQERALVIGGRAVTARNLRSYQTAHCDDYSNWAWWVAAAE